VVLTPLDFVLARVEVFDPLVPPLGGRTPPFWAAELRKGTARPAAVEPNRSRSPSARRGEKMCVQVTM